MTQQPRPLDEVNDGTLNCPCGWTGRPSDASCALEECLLTFSCPICSERVPTSSAQAQICSIDSDCISTELSAAFHEAGHCLVAHVLELPLEYCEVHYCVERQRWEGSFKVIWPTAILPHEIMHLLKSNALISLAGFIAQTFHAVHVSNAKPEALVFFDAQAIESFLRSNTRDETSPGCFLAWYNNRLFQINGRVFSSVDSKALNKSLSQMQLSVQDLLQEATEIIRGSWEIVSRLAMALVSQDASIDGKKVLANELLTRNLESAG